jgi:SAM-dependent methyltransferase
MEKAARYTSEYYLRDADEFWFGRYGLLRPDELAALCYTFGRPFAGKGVDAPRVPGTIYSIGCGEGRLEAQLERMGCEVYGVDPSPGARELYRGSCLLTEYPGGGSTILFVESIEHLWPQEFWAIWTAIPPGARVIIVNWLDFWPIEPDNTGYDHVTLVDDALYDRLSVGHRVVVRRGSHLVVERVS